MTNNRNFCISGSMFGEFKIIINLDLTDSNEDIVKIAGFGTFKVRKKNKRMGRNPKTGIEAEISERRVVTYHASDKIKKRLNLG